ncbi:MAG: DUF3445 domain-containing protein [Burkholderiales bacterium]|nr:DUF3445 domain-containing protein [Burkholderiales bacterium]
MSIRGIYTGRCIVDAELIKTLRTDDMERFSAVPKTVMINQWLDGMDWLVIDRTYPAQIARRHELLNSVAGMVIDRLPDETVTAAEIELRDTMVDYLLQIYPQYFQRQDNFVSSPLTGLVIDIGDKGADPLIAVALLASEDMLLLLPEKRGPNQESVYLLKSGALLFPNDWSLRSHFKLSQPAGQNELLEKWKNAKQKSEKAARLGKSPYEIHDGHVEHYVQNFASRVDLFFDRMEPGMRTWRRNWGPRMTGELFLHADALPDALPALTAQNWAEHGYLRSEHETFTKLPKTGAVVFGIKTYLWKLSELAKNPAALRALVTASDNLAPAMFDYRAESLPSFRDFLERYRPAS